MKILYVSQYFPPEMGAPAARVAELSRHWVTSGHEVTVLTGFPNHPTGVVPQEYRRDFRRLVKHEAVDGINVVRSWLLPFPNRKTYERMLNYSSFCLSAGTTGMFISRPDILIATSPQLLVGLSGWWLARTKRVPFVFEVRDLWPESLAAVGVGEHKSALNRGLGAIAGFLYKHADHIVVVTPAFVEQLVKNWNVPREKISVVQNGVETELFAPQDGSSLRRELGMADRFVILYAGTMGMAHGLDTIIDSATQLKTSFPQALFLMVGEGADKQRVVDTARERGLDNIHWIGQQPREKMPEFIAASDVCLVLLKKTELFKTVIPTKMLEFMSCARPIILGVDGQAREIAERAGASMFIEPENATALTQAVGKFAANPSLMSSMGRNGRFEIVNRFSRQQSAEEYLEVLQNRFARGIRQPAIPAAKQP